MLGSAVFRMNFASPAPKRRLAKTSRSPLFNRDSVDLGLTAEQGATAPLLFLFTARPEFRTVWSLRSHHNQIALNRLRPPEVQTMLRQVGARALPETAIAALPATLLESTRIV
jgi:hypothetical protein